MVNGLRCRARWTLTAVVAVLAAGAVAGAAQARVEFGPSYCGITLEPDIDVKIDTTSSLEGTGAAPDLEGGPTLVSGSCYDWGVSPAYTGTVYADEASAAAAEPPPPPIPTPSLATWRNLYDWPGGHGYAGWYSSSSSQPAAYGAQSALGGQHGLWLWPVGGTSRSYANGNYVEWTYTAPGTTRISNAQLVLSYRNKLLAHHCIDIGLRTGSTIVYRNEHCKPVRPPDSQRQVSITLADPSSNPTSKTLYFRIRVDCGGASTCSKNIPQHDPLSTGGFARLMKVDMTLVDDDNPVLQRVTDGVDGFNDRYTVTVKATDAGAGIKSLQIAREGQPPFASANAPCDSTHRTPALDNRICPESFSLTGTLDISDLEDGVYTFVATAVDLAGHVGTLRWTVTIERVSLDIALDPLTATPRDRYTTARQTQFGWNASELVPASSTRQAYKWRFTLAPSQRLVLLPGGGLAVVTDDGTGLDPDPDDDYSDGEAVNPGDATDELPADALNDGLDGFPDEERPEEGGEDLGELPPESTNDDEAGTPLGALAQAQDALGDAVDAVVTPPVARDALGRPVPASFAVKGNIAVLTISHRGSPRAYPVTASSDLVEQTGETPESAFAPLAGLLSAQATTCDGKPRPKVITYDPQGFAQLLDAFKAFPIPCADYFIGIGSPPAAEGDTPAVKWRKKRVVRPGGVQVVCAANGDRRIRDAGAAVFPVAEFSWSAWRDYARRLGFANIQSAWRKAGREFRRVMKSAGYGGTCAATGQPILGNWAINEFPSTLTVRAFDKVENRWIEPREVWGNARAATHGLYYGYDGSGAAEYPQVSGTVFVIDPGHHRAYFKAYRNGWHALLQQKGFWRELSTYVRFWGQESYTNCFKACLLKPDGAPYGRATRAQHVNAYALHSALLADKGGTASEAARTFYRSRYFTLLNGFWGRTFEPPSGVYGQTDKVDLERMLGLVSLQVYSVRRRATGASGTAAETSAAHTRYPHLRVGFAWHDEAPTIMKDGAPVTNPDFEPNERLAARIAQALQSAYSQGGNALAACSYGQESFCLRSVPKAMCAPQTTRTVFNQCWLKDFSLLGWNGSPVDCVVRPC